MSACPMCDGKGYTTGLACPGGYWRDFGCDYCAGTGQIDEARLAKIEAGKQMRDVRRERGISQRDRARELSMDVVAYSRLENGRE